MCKITGWTIGDLERMTLDQLTYWVDLAAEYQRAENEAIEEANKQKGKKK